MTRQRLMLTFIEFTGGLRHDSCLVFSLLTRLCEALARLAERSSLSGSCAEPRGPQSNRVVQVIVP